MYEVDEFLESDYEDKNGGLVELDEYDKDEEWDDWDGDDESDDF